MSLKTKAENQVKGQVKDVLVGSSLFDNVEVGLNLAMNFDQTTESTHEYYAPDGQTNGWLAQRVNMNRMQSVEQRKHREQIPMMTIRLM